MVQPNATRTWYHMSTEICNLNVDKILTSCWQGVQMVDIEGVGKISRGLREYFYAASAVSTILYGVRCNQSFCSVSDIVCTMSIVPVKKVQITPIILHRVTYHLLTPARTIRLLFPLIPPSHLRTEISTVPIIQIIGWRPMGAKDVKKKATHPSPIKHLERTKF